MAKGSGFLREFIRERKTVGALYPSSKFLMKNMVKHVDFSKAKVIAELGPGNGVFTKGILERMAPDAKLFTFELNEKFCQYMEGNIKDDRMVLLNQSAEDLGKVLKEHGFEKADYIVSALPLMVIPKEMKTNVLKACTDSLSPDGHFIQFQYSLNAKKLLQETFSEVKVHFTAANIPPAFVYKCSL
ncbi:MAG: phosphatidylethanolamine/phosphatidyl-N-methylethanolamine N-methyltransferase [Flavobacteriales bacterium]